MQNKNIVKNKTKNPEYYALTETLFVLVCVFLKLGLRTGLKGFCLLTSDA